MIRKRHVQNLLARVLLVAFLLGTSFVFPIVLDQDTANAVVWPADVPLQFEVTDAVMAPDCQVLYVSSKSSKKVYAISYMTGQISVVEFAYMPESLEIGKGAYSNELYVGLSPQNHSSYWWKENQYGEIGVIDRNSLTVVDNIPIQVDPFDIVAGRDGWLYVTSGSGQFTNFDSYNRVTKQRIHRSNIRQMSYAKLNPNFDRIYTINTDVSPRDYYAYNIANGTFTDPTYPGGYDSPYHGDYELNPYFEIDPSGGLLFNGSGTMFTCNLDKANDMRYVGKLLNPFNGIAFDSNLARFYTVQANSNALLVYNGSTNQVITALILDGEGKFIFKKGSDLIIIKKMPSGSDAPYKIQVYPTYVTSLSVLVDPPSEQAIGNSVTITAGVTGGILPEYRFWTAEPGQEWQLLQDWSTNYNCTWIPGVAGVNQIKIEARSCGADYVQSDVIMQYMVKVPVAGIVLDQHELTLKQSGAATTLTAAVSPADATNKAVEWVSSNPSVAKVDNGVVTPVSGGVTDITVSTQDGGFSDTCRVTVQDSIVRVTGVALNKSSLLLTQSGASYQLISIITPPNATNKNVTWRSSNPKVATVINGVVKPIKAGTAVITVTTQDGGFKAYCVVTVNKSWR